MSWFSYSIKKKNASVCRRILVETNGNPTPTVKACERWFERLKKDDGHFDVIDKERENRSKKFEDDEQSLLDKADTQIQQMMA